MMKQASTKAAPKFKEGDRVVNVVAGRSNTNLNWNMPLHTSGVITEIGYGIIRIKFNYDYENQSLYSTELDQIELQSVHDSPLNQELR